MARGHATPVEIVLGGHSDALLDLVGRYGTGWLPVLPTTAEHYARAARGRAQRRRASAAATRTRSCPASTSTR